MSILAIGAHPDDIEIGCGGSLMRYAQKGEKVYMFVLTRGEIGGKPELRECEQEKAARYMKVKKIFWGGYKDTEIPRDRSVINRIESVIKEVKPDTVLFNYLSDIHQDHRALAHAALSATRYIREVLFYEVPTTQNFEPDVFVDISKVMEKKLQLLRIHCSQVHRTRIENLSILESAKSCAIFRGFQGRVKYAEGFKALRILKEI
ncbi:MAG TPA: GlcNAc-PI de-N-acetylase [Candidatus Omnitrophica bacterium]|nr:GlcNAc-PI de-N-acetylase [Candidatus Omnitrophota bacterium]